MEMRVTEMNVFSVSAVCGIGMKRQNNEDNLYINGVYLDESAVECSNSKVFEYNAELEGDLRVAVCDGMGGENAGEKASLIAVSKLCGLPCAAQDNEVFAHLRQINTALTKEAAALGVPRIGCTIAMLSISDGVASVVNVGDSRVYRLRKQKIEQLTHDQSQVQAYIDAGIISQKDARKHPLRHRILQHLGMKDEDLFFEQVRKEDVCSGDVFLVCSDGLTDCLEDRDICSLIRSGASAWNLYDAAMQNGGTDNTTIILVRVK